MPNTLPSLIRYQGVSMNRKLALSKETLTRLSAPSFEQMNFQEAIVVGAPRVTRGDACSNPCITQRCTLGASGVVCCA
jgi:hypothetical protein